MRPYSRDMHDGAGGKAEKNRTLDGGLMDRLQFIQLSLTIVATIVLIWYFVADDLKIGVGAIVLYCFPCLIETLYRITEFQNELNENEKQ